MVRDFKYIEEQIRKNTFGILGTVDEKNRPHTTGILYGVSAPEDPFAVYIATISTYKKTRNIRQNPNVSFAIPYPRHLLWFIPASVISFQGTAEILPVDDEPALRAFESKWILRENIKIGESNQYDAVFIRIQPIKKIHVFGVGVGIIKALRNPAVAAYSVTVPDDRK